MKNDDGYIDDIDGIGKEEYHPEIHEGNVVFGFTVSENPQWVIDLENEGIKTYEHAAKYVTDFMKKDFKEHGETLCYEAINEPNGFLSPAEFAAALCFMEQEIIEKFLYFEKTSYKNMRQMDERLKDIEERLNRLL